MSINLLGMILSIPGILIAFSFREYSRAWMADKLGDKTPRFQGQLTLNPLAHINIVGLVLMLFTGFGWSKPVTINRYAFKNPKKDALKVNITAWISNIIVALIASIIYIILLKFIRINNNEFLFIILVIFRNIVVINVNLFVFNTLPLPGLDGFRILEDLSPKIFYKVASVMQEYYSLILVVIIMLGKPVLAIPSSAILNLISKIASLFI
ncbi:site-2 protease family protein [Clostridium tarantellae]|uniref:Site-2 protease family protein n=1 Tax=Clostridium tarantellae TaxID=39493 RepID=A0A6I1MQ22_9CLOT|nr:site-2 protease family protein [Clostridium tarantellae]MPQ44332.1 site-2 protease family protein [Clostridium tarantellae]